MTIATGLRRKGQGVWLGVFVMLTVGASVITLAAVGQTIKISRESCVNEATVQACWSPQPLYVIAVVAGAVGLSGIAGTIINRRAASNRNGSPHP